MALTYVYLDKDGKEIDPPFYEWVQVNGTADDLATHNAGDSTEFNKLLYKYFDAVGATHYTEHDDVANTTETYEIGPILIPDDYDTIPHGITSTT
jgi:hypothetical protein